MQKVLSSQSRLEKIVEDILLDMETRPRLMDGHGNAMLVTSSIYQACKCYELFTRTQFKRKCAIVTSYKPSPADIKGEQSGEGLTERLLQYDIYRNMLANWFCQPPEKAMYRVDEFETEVKEKFIKEPGQMKLLIDSIRPIKSSLSTFLDGVNLIGAEYLSQIPSCGMCAK